LRSILLIGGGGYIGPVIAQELLNQSHSVTVLDLLIYKNDIGVKTLKNNPKFKFILGDFCKAENLDDALIGITDVIILGGLVGDPITKKYPIESHAINDVGIINCIRILKRKNLNRVIFISTCSNYGLIANDELATEDFPLTPLSLYSKSKVKAETFILTRDSDTNYIPTVIRFATAFGIAPRMRFDLTVNEFVAELYFNKKLEIFDADTWRPYCHVNDFARLINLVLDAPENLVSYEVFNAGSDSNNCTKRSLVEIIRGFIPLCDLRFLSNGSDPRNYKVNFNKVQSVLGFQSTYSLEKGVEDLIYSLGQGSFNSYLNNKNFYGNYEIEYPKHA
jgi:nucleoside-diphosphate-sugar epimerase